MLLTETVLPEAELVAVVVRLAPGVVGGGAGGRVGGGGGGGRARVRVGQEDVAGDGEQGDDERDGRHRAPRAASGGRRLVVLPPVGSPRRRGRLRLAGGGGRDAGGRVDHL